MVGKALKWFNSMITQFKVRFFAWKFLFNIVKEADVYTHNIHKISKDKKSKRTVTSNKELLDYSKDIREGNLFVDGKQTEYISTTAVMDHDENIFFVVFYSLAS